MVGRATRRCDDIGKTVFRIYDPVDIYAALQDVNTMKPLVKNPDITLEQLAEELTDPQKLEAALHSPGEQQGETQADVVLSQLSQKLVRVLRKANKKAENRERNQTYGTHKRPEDYLDEFSRFISEQLNQSAALSVVVNKPRDLTRQQLREVKLLLDNHGYSEAHLQSAVRKQTNKDIAASIIGHIRRAALGEALIPFEQRVATAMGNIYTRHSWTPAQRKWLDRLAKQLVHEVIIDRDFVNNRFAEDGGAKRMEKVLGDQLDVVLEELNDAMWPLQSA
ncbi:type I restriction-modification enzyme R subunit C-terminal domain-containing protein [Marinobacter sp. LV10MA510-1]|uniref:type I restriction-modification enzyme R subunit C-terminal domain-containing protein n=1 Tax=Marinobacter sp. LV10MA510-1 TaxID=1415567 RepID=UPI003A5CDE2B